MGSRQYSGALEIFVFWPCDGKDRKNALTEEKDLHRRVRTKKELRLHDGVYFIMSAAAEIFLRNFKERNRIFSLEHYK